MGGVPGGVRGGGDQVEAAALHHQPRLCKVEARLKSLDDPLPDGALPGQEETPGSSDLLLRTLSHAQGLVVPGHLEAGGVHLVQDNLTCVGVSEDPRDPWHQLDTTSGQPGSVVQRVVEDKDEEDVELLVEGAAEGGHLDPIDGTVALAVRADKLVLLPKK